VFRGKFTEGLRELHAEGKLGFHGTLAVLQNPKAFAAWPTEQTGDATVTSRHPQHSDLMASALGPGKRQARS
jgi:hypothetical protein